MEMIIRFTKVCPFPIRKIVDGKERKVLLELVMYTTKKEYYANFMLKGRPVRDFVVIDSYGLLVTEVYEKDGEILKSEPIDLGVKSAHPRHINSFIHEISRLPISGIGTIRERYEEEATSHTWCEGWPDALAQVASVQLGRNLSGTQASPFTERIREKHNRLMRKLNPLRHFPKPKPKNGGLDA
jgi:hypothetical protein